MSPTSVSGGLPSANEHRRGASTFDRWSVLRRHADGWRDVERTRRYPVAAAQPCPDIDVTFVRGLGDAPGPGPLGDAFINSLRSKVGGRSVGVYGVNYAASSNFLTVSDGVADATNHVNDMIANCPATRLVLGGFSEGAAVVDFLVGAAPSVPAIPGVPVALPGLDVLSGTGPTNPLPPAAVDHVAAVAVFGNPLTRVSGPLNGLAGPYGPKTIDLCHAGDPLCGGGSDWNAHHEYVPGLTDQAAAFVAGLV